jgi:Tol biopolymer transport system component
VLRRKRDRVRSLAAISGLLGAVLLVACARPASQSELSTRLFDHPQRVAVEGYDGDAMEPFITRDGRYLLFNNLNDPSVDTNLHVAERIDDLHFRYRGELRGANTKALEGVASMDRDNRLYFVSTRSYEQSLSTIYRGRFADGAVGEVEIVPGVSRQQRGMLNFDVEISPDGSMLYFVDARFGRSGPETADIVIADRAGAGFVRRPDSERLMRNINTPALEYAPSISADGLMLLFTRFRPGPFGIGGEIGIYVAERAALSEPFEAARRLEALDGLVEAPSLSPDERAIYFHRKDGARFVVYRAVR